jgi:transposase
MAQTLTIVGIDVSKDKVDAAIRSAAVVASFAATADGRRQLRKWLRQHGVTRAVMEASGGYERPWAAVLREAGLEVRIVDPKRVRYFAKSAGRLAKNDPIDADMIARFGEAFALAEAAGHDAEREELDRLVSFRMALTALQVQLTNQAEHDPPAAVRKATRTLKKAISAQLAEIEATIADAIERTQRFAERAEIIQSVPGLAAASTAGLIALLPELGHADARAAAALLGVAPYDDDSGKRQGRRCIKGGRHKLRKLLFIPIVGAATQHNPVLKAYYKRLIAKGKPAKVALIACMRKLIVILNTMLARKEKWDPQRHALA